MSRITATPEFQALLEAAPDAMIIVDKEGIILHTNARTEALFGYPREELYGRPVEMLIPGRFRDAHPERRRHYFRDPRPRPMGSAAGGLYGLRRDGSEFPAEISLSPMTTAEDTLVIAAVRDGTARRKMEQTFRGLLEAAHDAMVVTDQAGRIVLVNAQAERLFGYPRDELLNQPVEVLIPERFRPAHPAHREAYAHEPRTRPMGAGLALSARRRDGSEFPAEISLSPLETPEGLLAITAVRDATDTTNIQLRLRERAEQGARDLQRAVEVLEGGDAAFVLDCDWRLVLVNRNFERLTGVPRTEALGRHIANVLPATTVAESRYRLEFQRVLEEHTAVQFEEFYAPLGMWTDVTAYPTAEGGVAAFFRDVTERKRTEREHAELLDREQQTRALLDTFLKAAPVAVGFLDADLRYIRVNDALAALNRHPVEEHLGHTVREVLPETADMIEPMLHQILESGEPLRNFIYEVAAGSATSRRLTLLANYFPISLPGGRSLGVGGVIVDITEARRAELALRESEERFRAIFNLAAVGLALTTLEGAFIRVNQRYCDMLGYTEEELHGMTFQEITHQGDLEESLARLRRLDVGEIDTLTMEKRYRRKDGTLLWVQVSVASARGPDGRAAYRISAVNDVTARKHSEEGLRLLSEAGAVLSQSLDYQTTVANIAHLAVPALADWCVVDLMRDARTLDLVSVAHVRPEREALAYALRRNYPPDPDSNAFAPWRVIKSGKPILVPEISDEMLAQRLSDPEALHLTRTLGLRSVMYVPLVASGRILGAMSFVSAESGRLYTEADLELASELGRRVGLAIEYTALYQEAQRAIRVREDVLAVVSHDLRNPLSAVQMSASFLARKGLQENVDPRVRKQVEVIQRSANRMEHLIGDLLDMASIRAGQLAMEMQPQDAVELVLEACEAHEPLAYEKSLTLLKDLAIAPIEVSCDRDRVLQVFANLIGNSIKFSRPGESVTVQARRLEDDLLFAVVDTGPGIPEEDLPHIFDPYWFARRHNKKGTGLGLFISKGIVEAHGGRIWVESQASVGSAFYFTLPIQSGLAANR